MSDFNFAHQLGQVEGRINALERKVEVFEQRIESKLGSIEAKLDQLNALLNLGRGGWRAALLLGSFGVAVATLVGWLVDHLPLRPGVGP